MPIPRNSWSNNKADDTLDLELTADQNSLLFRALVSSYTNFTKIRIMVYRDLHDALDDISPDLDKQSGVMALMQWAKAEGKVQELSDALIAAKPGNQSVQAYYRSVSKQTLSPAPSVPPTPVNPEPPKSHPINHPPLLRLPSIVPPERIKPEAPVAPPVNPLVPPAVPPTKVPLHIKPAKLLLRPSFSWSPSSCYPKPVSSLSRLV